MTLPLTRVRFVIADENIHEAAVWQGYSDGTGNMAGDDVYVTADTLRNINGYMQVARGDTLTPDPLAPVDPLGNDDDDYEVLAFGGDTANGALAAFAPDGVTPLYLRSWYCTIVQRFDRTLGRWGEWVNVGTIFGKPRPMGFSMDRREDTPFDRDSRVDEADEVTA